MDPWPRAKLRHVELETDPPGWADPRLASASQVPSAPRGAEIAALKGEFLLAKWLWLKKPVPQ